MTARVCLAGATGWAGSERARGIAGARVTDFVERVTGRPPTTFADYAARAASAWARA
ncbi:MAG TPA: hypothetical protein VIR34_05395 [Gemmatimonadaceae bacterium]